MIKYKYDSNENITNIKYNLGGINNEIINTFNDDDLIINTLFSSKKIDYTYDLLGRLKGSKINDAYEISYEYMSNGKNTSTLLKKLKSGNDIYSYKYDKLNNLTHVYKNDELLNKYYYDDYNQLIKEIDFESEIITKYKYDNVGNMLYKKVYDLNTYKFITKDIYNYNNENQQDQLTKFNNTIITYDEIGNPLTIGDTINLTWINGRELETYNDGINLISYKYNSDGIRISKKVNNNETKYYLEDNDIIFEKKGNNVLYYLRNDIDDLFGFMYNDDLYYYIKNNTNDIIGILDSSHNIVAKYKYDSWGKVISITDCNGYDISNDINNIANINPFRYRSYYYDSETKLYYLNSRYYNPGWKRFINPDSYGGEVGGNILSHNMYAYALNNPIGNYDEDGNLALSLSSYGLAFAATLILAPLAKKVIGGTAKVISSLINDISHSLSKPKSKPKQKKSSREKAQSKTKVKTAVKIKAGTKPQNNKRNEEKPCVVAIKGNDNRILITNVRMTIDETHDYVEMGGDVMCDSRSYAKRVAKRFDGWYEDRKIKNEIGYYRHFHPWNDRKHPHIWYYSRF